MTRHQRHQAIRHVYLENASKGFHLLGSDKVSHLRKVLRLEWGAHLSVTDGSGKLFSGVFEQSGGKGGIDCKELLVDEMADDGAGICELVIGLPKNTTMDTVVEKAVELGVRQVTPVVASRSVVKPDPKELKKYQKRWRAIAEGALEQSEGLWLPEIGVPVEFSKWVGTVGATSAGVAGVSSFAFISESRSEIENEREVLLKTRKALENAGKKSQVFIGPEGGVSSDERRLLADAGFTELSLGKSVLRVETAVISALALVRFLG